jgi:hypothetical protein
LIAGLIKLIFNSDMSETKRYSSVIAVVVVVGIIYIAVTITRSQKKMKQGADRIQSLMNLRLVDSLLKAKNYDSVARTIDNDSFLKQLSPKP